MALTALAVTRAKAPGLYGDGNGLYLQVSRVGSKSWLLRFRLHGRRRDMGLGALADVSLADARVKAQDARKLIAAGIDPIDARHETRAKIAVERASALTFKAAAESYIEAHAASWRNPKHATQWPNTLRDYVYPVIGKLPVAAVNVGHVIKILEPIWTKKPETASRVRGRVEAVLDWAKARGYRTGENPARWRGHLENLMPKRGKLQAVKHHPALPYDEAGAFMADLKEQEGTAPLAFRFLILTAARTSEVIGARWSEIDLGKGVWTIPAARIKTGREHRVPLSAPALVILKALPEARASDKDDAFVFPGGRKGKPLSTNALLAVLDRMGRDTITAHGFRSTFRDWCAEQTNYPREVAEAALAHAVGDKVEAAYRRSDLFEKRTQLMKDWATYCGTVARPEKAARVVPIWKRR
jgi:integrase